MSEVAAPASSAPVADVSADSANAQAPASEGVLPTKGAAAADKSADVKVAPTPPPAPTKRKIKVEGAEEELTDDQLVALAQKGRFYEKKASSLTAKEKALQERIARIEQDPFGALKDLKDLGIDKSIDLRELAIQKLAEEFKAEQLKEQDPAAYERAQLQKELDARDAKLKEYETAKQQEAHAQLIQTTQQEILTGYGQALQSVGMEITEDVAAKMLEIGMLSIEHGLDLTPEQLATETKAYFEAQDSKWSKSAEEKFKGRYATLEGEDLLKAVDELSDGMVKKLQGALLARARASIGRPPPPVQKVEETQGPTKREYKSEADVMKRLGIIG